MYRLLLFITCITLAPLLYSHPSDHPRIGLVLSGGGAKGGAHIGVLQVIDQMQIPIDFVVGTSMGAVVGGLYAAGYSGEQIERLLTDFEWEKILRNIVDRDYTYYRRKRDDDLFLLKEFIGFRDGQLQLPRGVVQGHKLYQSYKKLILPREPIKSFDNLPIPFRAVATDLESGAIVVLNSGDLAQAMYASMAVPGLFAPVIVGDHLLVDGGVSSNIPVEIAKGMGADLLIVVDVGSPMMSKDQIKGFQSVLNQLSNIQVRDNANRSLQLLTTEDILIHPNMGEVDTEDYGKIADAVEIGVQAANDKSIRLKPLSQANFYNEGNHLKDSVYIQNIHVINNTPLCTDIFYQYLPKAPGSYSIKKIDESISRLYGLELFEKVMYSMDGDTFVVEPVERSWGPNYIQSTLQLSTDFEGDSGFRFALGVTRTLRNSMAGELRFFGAIGFTTGALLEWYQPLTTDLAWYILPQIAYFRESFPIFVMDMERARYLNSRASGLFALGRNFQEWGRAEVGIERIAGCYRLKVGPLNSPEFNYDEAYGYGRFEWDTLDNSYFPDKGTRGEIQYSLYRTSIGGDQKFDQLQISNLLAYTWGKHSFVLAGRYETTTSNTSSLNAQFKLGGLFRLSGLLEKQLFGQEAALFDVLYFYKFKEINVIPNYPFPMYLGFSLETGNAWQTKRSLLKHSFRKGGSIFAGMDTILGPFYLGYGVTENGQRAAHLYMGRLF